MGIIPGTIAVAGDRWTPFHAELRFEGIDLTSAVMEAHVRLDFDTPGTPLVDLDTVLTSGAQGIYLKSVETVASVKISTIIIQINETTMEGLPAGAEVGDDVPLAMDLLINPSAALNPGIPALKQRYLKMPLTVEPGATQ